MNRVLAGSISALATALHAQPTFQWWLIDLASPQLLAYMSKSWGASVAKGNAPFRFAPADGTAFFVPLGWHEAQYRAMFEESIRLNRKMRGTWFFRLLGLLASPKRRAAMKRFSGIVLLRRSEEGSA